jgi:D-sedoheptulose 7-phosphate isomerase
MTSTIRTIFQTSAQLKEKLSSDESFIGAVGQGAALLAEAAKAGGTIFSCGNGGSTCDAMHLTEELIARYKRNRPGIRAMHFMDSSVITCWGNDFSYETAFERYAETFCSSRDVLIAISTSGNSKNIIAAARAAKAKSCKVVALTGNDGGQLAALGDVSIVVPSQATERIQEVHITVIHAWCELLETQYGLASS